MTKQIVKTANAPAARGCYSQGVIANGFLFCAGQLPLDPLSGQIVKGGVSAQAERVIRNLQAVIEAAGSSLQDVVKVTVFISDIAHWGEVNEVYGRFFNENPPARSVVPVKELHYGALIEIEAVAVMRE